MKLYLIETKSYSDKDDSFTLSREWRTSSAIHNTAGKYERVLKEGDFVIPKGKLITINDSPFVKDKDEITAVLEKVKPEAKLPSIWLYLVESIDKVAGNERSLFWTATRPKESNDCYSITRIKTLKQFSVPAGVEHTKTKGLYNIDGSGGFIDTVEERPYWHLSNDVLLLFREN